MKANRKFVEGEQAVSAVIGVILMVAITVAIAATVYVYVSGMLSEPGASAPSLAWSVDNANKQITITAGSAANTYAALATDANLILKSPTGTQYYVGTTYHLTSTQTGLCTKSINAGDVIKGFTSGSWQVIWEPTNKLLGTITVS